MNAKTLMAGAALALATIAGVPAQAATQARFVLTCTDCQIGGTFTDSWVTPFDAVLDPSYTESDPGYFFHVQPTSNIGLYAQSALYGGGYNYFNFSNGDTDAFAPGSVIYTGPTSALVWQVGTYHDVVNYFNPGQNDGTSTLTISAVPEPAAWVLMLVGFGALGASLRAGRKTASAAA